ncbi:MAG: hypothetical protein KAW12_15460 [Candidatus Aminicenantes bacterium]|nr:hypothetical protein [Candidatus Aminicenantes bacterium]
MSISKTNKAIVINGSARSGTTWLMDILGKNARHYSLFEPLDSRYKEAQELGLWFRYLDPHGGFPAEQRFFETLLGGNERRLTKIYNVDTRVCNFYFKFREKIVNLGSRRGMTPVIKFVRGHFFLKYLQENFNPKTIVIFRHPCAALESALRVGFIDTNFKLLLGDRSKKLFKAYPQLVKKVKKSLELLDYKNLWFGSVPDRERKGKMLIIRWCLSNWFMLNDILKNGLDAFVIFYEQLYADPDKEIAALCGRLGMDYSPSMREEAGKPAASVVKNSPAKEKEKAITPVNRWRTSLSPALHDFCFKIMEIFDIDIYSAEILPNPNSNLQVYLNSLKPAGSQ